MGRGCRLVAGELGDRLAVVLLIFPWGWHRKLPAERLLKRVERAIAGGGFAALWKLEALGFRYGATAPGARQDQPPPLPPDGLPRQSRLMLHVGLGMAVARRHLAGLSRPSRRSRSDRAADAAVRRFLTAVRRAASGEHLDAAVEPLGVVARFEDPRRVYAVARALRRQRPDLVDWFWHGVGRCLLFLPSSFVPLPGAAWRAARRIGREVPPGRPRRRARVGWACALTLVHMRRPWVVAELLRRHGGELESAPDRFADDFRVGVAEAIELRLEVTPGCDELVEGFLAHRSAGGREVAERWRRLVESPGLDALAAAVAAREPVARPAPARLETPAPVGARPLRGHLAPLALQWPLPLAAPAPVRVAAKAR